MKIFKKYFWRDLYWQVRNYFWPQNKWLTKCIPNGWLDKDALLEDILAATIIEFVEGEDGFKKTVWDDTLEKLAVYYKLNNAYHWFKWQRQALEERKRQIPWVCKSPFSAKDPLDKDLWFSFIFRKELLDNLHLQNIIKYRKHLWT